MSPLLNGVDTAFGPLALSRRRHRYGVPLSLFEHPGFVLLVAAAEIEDRYSSAVRTTGISLRDFIMLAEMAQRRGIGQTALAERLGLSRARVAEQAAVLEAAGCISREMNTRDLRRRRLYVDPDGERALEECRGHVRAIDADWLATLGVPDRSKFEECLGRLPPADIGRRPI